MEKIEFQTLIAEVAKAVHMTQYMMEQTQTANFLKYFEDTNGVLAPVTKEIRVTYYEGDIPKEGKFFVPVATLVPHNGLVMEQVDVTVRANLITKDDNLMADLSPAGKQDETQADDKLSDAGSQCEIKMSFRNKDASDGMREVVSMLNKTI